MDETPGLQWSVNPAAPIDLLVIGGGINGAGIARDAAGRGLSVMLVEQDDLAHATSSRSTKLVHGGLRYLEYYQFRLVRESLIEREIVLNSAPHIVWPLRFILPHAPHLRPAWLVRLGLFLYDSLGGRKKIRATKLVRFDRDSRGQPLKDSVKIGFEYGDCWVEDSRLVVLNAMDARARGAHIYTRTRLVSAHRLNGVWVCSLRMADGKSKTVRARALVNAAGPWVADILKESLKRPSKTQVRLVKGSHIIVPKLYEGNHAFILQNNDKRIVFTIPYEGSYTLIGTTDMAYDGDANSPEISDAEREYLCAAVSGYFRDVPKPGDIIWTYAGVRALYDDGAASASAVTRDYVLELDVENDTAPVLSVFGGKITTYRKLAEHALEKILPFFGSTEKQWTEYLPLPGGDMPAGDFDAFQADFIRQHPWLPESLAQRWCRAYGTCVTQLLDGAGHLEDLGTHFGDNIYQAELHYLITHEFARTAEDILWRRSKLGLHISPETTARIEKFCARLQD